MTLVKIFHDSKNGVGVNWHKAKADHEGLLISLLKKHKGAYEAYVNVQEFFKMAYVTWHDADASGVITGSYWTKFCTQKAL